VTTRVSAVHGGCYDNTTGARGQQAG